MQCPLIFSEIQRGSYILSRLLRQGKGESEFLNLSEVITKRATGRAGTQTLFYLRVILALQQEFALCNIHKNSL